MGCSSSTKAEAPGLEVINQEKPSQPAADEIRLDDIALGEGDPKVVMNPPSEELSAKEFETGKDYHSWSYKSNSQDKVRPVNGTVHREYEKALVVFLKQAGDEPLAIKNKVKQKRRACNQASKVQALIRGAAAGPIHIQVAAATPGEAESFSGSDSLSQ